MKIDDSLRMRIRDLDARATALTEHIRVDSRDLMERRAQECSGWLAAAQNAVHLVCANPLAPYRMRVDNICGGRLTLGSSHFVGEVAAILRALLLDIDNGLLASVSDQASAEVFDNFLDHAKAYLEQSRKSEAGVIAGVVFEDTLRKVCRKLGIVEKDVKLDTLISALGAKGELTAVKAKRARVAAHVRTKATHAQWNEFELNDVEATIEFTRELIASKLDA